MSPLQGDDEITAFQSCVAGEGVPGDLYEALKDPPRARHGVDWRCLVGHRGIYPLAEAAIFGEDPVLGLAEPGLGTRQLNQKSHRQQNPPRATMPRQRPPRP